MPHHREDDSSAGRTFKPVNRGAHIVSIAAMLFLSLALSGCFFAGGIAYDDSALRHTPDQGGNGRTIEIRARPWETGNFNVPFDFTVYRYDEVYEVTVPSDIGHFSGGDIELKGCGVPLVVVAAAVDLTRDNIKFDIQYNFRTSPTAKPRHLVGSMRIVDSSAAPESCVKPSFHAPSA